MIEKNFQKIKTNITVITKFFNPLTIPVTKIHIENCQQFPL